jgi:hypothetical protein
MTLFDALSKFNGTTSQYFKRAILCIDYTIVSIVSLPDDDVAQLLP